MGFLDLIFLFLTEAGLWRLLCQGPNCAQKNPASTYVKKKRVLLK